MTHGDRLLQRCSGDSVGPDVTQPLHRRMLRPPWPGKSGLGRSRHGWSAGPRTPRARPLARTALDEIDLPLSTATVQSTTSSEFQLPDRLLCRLAPSGTGERSSTIVVLAILRLRSAGACGATASMAGKPCSGLSSLLTTTPLLPCAIATRQLGFCSPGSARSASWLTAGYACSFPAS